METRLKRTDQAEIRIAETSLRRGSEEQRVETELQRWGLERPAQV